MSMARHGAGGYSAQRGALWPTNMEMPWCNSAPSGKVGITARPLIAGVASRFALFVRTVSAAIVFREGQTDMSSNGQYGDQAHGRHSPRDRHLGPGESQPRLLHTHLGIALRQKDGQFRRPEHLSSL